MVHHAYGSISYACRSYNMGKELGRPPRRDEVYINTHTRKNGVPSREAAKTIDDLRAIVEAQPKLKDKTIQQGDAYAAVCGAKEPRGRVRVLGIGPTPQEIRTPGLKGLMSTRMQMEIFARQKAESKLRALEQHIFELEEASIAHRRTNGEFFSQHDSTSRQYASPTPEGPTDVAHNDPRLEEYDNYVEEEDYDQYDEDDDNLLSHRHSAARSVRNITKTTTVRPCFVNNKNVEVEASFPPSRYLGTRSATNMTTTQTTNICVATEESLIPPRPTAPKIFESLLPHRDDETHSPKNNTITAKNDGPRFHDNLVGKNVILFAMLKSDMPVAKGTIVSTSPKTMVGGQLLGKEYCEVVVTVVMRRDAMLPRPYREITTMASALYMNIAWSYSKIKKCKNNELSNKTSVPPKGTVGSVGHKTLA